MSMFSSFSPWCSSKFNAILAHFGLTSDDGLLSFSKVVTLLVVFLPMSNVKAGLVIASAHGTKVLLALIAKADFASRDETKAISITEQLRAADTEAAKVFTDPDEDEPEKK